LNTRCIKYNCFEFVLSGAIAQVLSNVHADSYVGNNVALQQEAAKVGLITITRPEVAT
jgi:hypothetical protein